MIELMFTFTILTLVACVIVIIAALARLIVNMIE